MRKPHPAPFGRALAVGWAVLVVLALLAPARADGARSAFPASPLDRPLTSNLTLERELLSNLSAPSIGPGGTSSLSYRLTDPASFSTLENVVLTFQLYAFSGAPGGDPGSLLTGGEGLALESVAASGDCPVPAPSLPAADAPVLATATTSGLSVNVSLGDLPTDAAVTGSVRVLTSSATPTGTYAIRTALVFSAGSVPYRFESRGWFCASAWANATEGPNGSATINASRLGVSGIVPETAVYVAASDWPVALAVLAGAGFALAGVGAWLYLRSGPGSRSGVGKDDAPGATNAPSALGKRRSRPGDSRSS